MCAVVKNQFPGFFLLFLCAVTQASHLEKSHNRLTCRLWRSFAARFAPDASACAASLTSAGAGCAILVSDSGVAPRTGTNEDIPEGWFRDRPRAWRKRDGPTPAGRGRRDRRQWPAGRPVGF